MVSLPGAIVSLGVALSSSEKGPDVINNHVERTAAITCAICSKTGLQMDVEGLSPELFVEGAEYPVVDLSGGTYQIASADMGNTNTVTQMASIELPTRESFVGRIRSIIPKGSSEITQEQLEDIGSDYDGFYKALQSEISSSNVSIGNQTKLEGDTKPDTLSISNYFLGLSITNQILVVQNFTKYGDVANAVSSVLPHLGESREILEGEFGDKFMGIIAKSSRRIDKTGPEDLANTLLEQETSGEEISVEDYMSYLEGVRQDSGLYSAYLLYARDKFQSDKKNNGKKFSPYASEAEFYAILDQALKSRKLPVETNRWSEKDKTDRRFFGKVEIFIGQIMTKKPDDYEKVIEKTIIAIGFDELGKIFSGLLPSPEVIKRGEEEMQALREKGDRDQRDIERQINEAHELGESFDRVAKLLSGV